MSAKSDQNGFRVTRRGLLIGAGVAGAGLVVGAVLGRSALYEGVNKVFEQALLYVLRERNPTVWFEVLPSNVVRLIVPKVEMGQGIHTALAQVAADELGAAWGQIHVVQGDTKIGPSDLAGTIGSASVAQTYMPLRTAAATLREMLIARAATMLKTEPSLLEAVDGVVRSRTDSRVRLTFGDIVATREHWPLLDEEPRLKAPDQFKFIGRPMPRVDFASKVRGKACYGYDLRVDGMLYGAVARPNRIGARMVRAAPGAASQHPGVVRVVIDLTRQFAGVVAKTRQQARDAVTKLDIEWRADRIWSVADIEAMLDVSDGAGAPVQRDGEVEQVFQTGVTLAAEYHSPMAVHAQLEPQAALADVNAKRAIIQVSTQMPSAACTVIAKALDMDESSVRVTPSYLGGAFGRKTGFEPGTEAALLSRAVGRPVHVGWTRAEEMRNGFFRPPVRNRFTARLENGRIAALRHNHASGVVLFGSFPLPLQWALGGDPGAALGARNFYSRIENFLLSTKPVELPVPTSAWRGLGGLPNAFATECFMDEMAHAAGVDPLQFRLRHLGDEPLGRRMRAVLEAAAQRAGYADELPRGRSRGIACSVHGETLVAMVAEVSVDGDGTVRVHRATQAVDAGRIVNPDGALAQAQGSIVMGLGSALLEQVTLTDGAVTASNFDGYPLITIDRVPEIDVLFLDSDEPPHGMGEPSINPVAAAVGNALFNLTGKRLRRLPFTPDRVLAA